MSRFALLGAFSIMLVGGVVSQAGAQSSPVSSEKAVVGDGARGKTVFARCAACHDLNTGVTRLGPSLKGVIGRTSGTSPNFNYSQALKDKAVVWNAASLDQFLASPAKFAPGNRMAYPPMNNPQDRADLVAFIDQAAN